MNPLRLYRVVDENLTLSGSTVTLDEFHNTLSIRVREQWDTGNLIARWIPTRFGGGIYEGEPEFDYNEWLSSGALWRTVAVRRNWPDDLAETFEGLLPKKEALPKEYVQRLHDLADAVRAERVDPYQLDKLMHDLFELSEAAGAAANLVRYLQEILEEEAHKLDEDN